MRRKILLSFCAAVALIIVTLAAAAYFAPKAKAPAFLQNSSTNGYSALMEAADAQQGRRTPENPLDYESYVQSNRVAFAKLDAAVLVPCEAPASFYSPSWDGTSDFAKLRALANAALIRGKAADARNDWNAAATAYVQVFKLALAVEHGPFIYALVGMAIEGNVQAALGPVLRKMEPSARERLCSEIKQLNAGRITFAQVREREFYFMDRHARNFIEAAYAKHIGSRKSIARLEKRINDTAKRWDELCP
jgi:hypothetical protein